MNGPATTSATSVVEPPIRRTTTGRNAAMTPMYTPAMRPEKASSRKFARTRSADQLRSGTRTKVAATRLVVAPVPVAIDRNCAAVIYRSGVKSPPGRGGRTPPGRGGYGRRVPYGPDRGGPPGRGPLRNPPGAAGRKPTGPRAPGAAELTTPRRFGSRPPAPGLTPGWPAPGGCPIPPPPPATAPGVPARPGAFTGLPPP